MSTDNNIYEILG